MVAVCVLFLCLSAGLWAADPALGFWKSIDDDSGKITAGWEIYEKDGILYGEILKVVGYTPDEKAAECKTSYKGFPVVGDVSQMLLVGTPWIYSMEKKDTGEWKGGYVIDPENGKRYACEITFHLANGKKYKGDTLEMRGKVGPFGRSQFWQRSTKDEIMAL